MDVEIFGMEGIPEADLRAHEQQILASNGPNEKKQRMLDEIETQSVASSAVSGGAGGDGKGLSTGEKPQAKTMPSFPVAAVSMPVGAMPSSSVAASALGGVPVVPYVPPPMPYGIAPPPVPYGGYASRWERCRDPS